MKKHYYYLLVVLICILACGCGIKKPDEVYEYKTIGDDLLSEDGNSLEFEDNIFVRERNDENGTSDEVVLLIDKVKNGASKEEFRQLCDKHAVCDNLPDIVKEWNRTNVHSSHCATLNITNEDENGFDFIIDAQYYFHSGVVQGRAYFVSDNCAIYSLDDVEIELSEEECEYVAFVIEDGNINVYASANSAKLGLGMNVYVDGSYTDIEPIYTNAGILGETYTKEQLDFLKNNLPSNYYDDIIFATEIGGVSTYEEDGYTIVEVHVPTAGDYDYAVKIKDEAIVTVLLADGSEFNY